MCSWRHPDYELRARENSLRYKRLRDEAYEQGWDEFDDLVKEPTFRDFVCMYIGEGSKRSRNKVAICNSNSTVMTRRLLGSPFRLKPNRLLDPIPRRPGPGCAAALLGKDARNRSRGDTAPAQVEQQPADWPHVAVALGRSNSELLGYLLPRKAAGMDGSSLRGMARFGSDRGVAQPGRAPALGAGGFRRFESGRPD
jgi:hypothetical protein